MDGPEGGAVLHTVGLALSQHALVDPGEIISLHPERQRDAAQQSQCQRPGVNTETRQSWPQLRTVLRQQLIIQLIIQLIKIPLYKQTVQCILHTSSGKIAAAEMFFMSKVSLTSS